jgi:PhnB protein
MPNIRPYLTFNGNCREAMEFYRNCLGGELTLQRIGDSPLGEQLPPEMKACILHSTLQCGELVLMASDMVGERGLLRGNAVSLMLNCASEAEIEACYRALAAGGQATHPPERTFWGALFGDLTDRFGNQWLLHYDENAA